MRFGDGPAIGARCLLASRVRACDSEDNFLNHIQRLRKANVRNPDDFRPGNRIELMENRESEESHFMRKDLAKTILSQIREDEIVASAATSLNIPRPHGERLEMGRICGARWEDAGPHRLLAGKSKGPRQCRWPVEGTGNGKSLMFNGHMDTSNTGRETFLTGLGYKAKAAIRKGMIYGLGIYNMKGALVCYTRR